MENEVDYITHIIASLQYIPHKEIEKESSQSKQLDRLDGDVTPIEANFLHGAMSCPNCLKYFTVYNNTQWQPQSNIILTSLGSV